MPNQLCSAVRVREDLYNSIESALKAADVLENWEPGLTWFVKGFKSESKIF